MTDLENSTKSKLVTTIETAWTSLETFLTGLTEGQMTDLCDDQGWSIKDHITHLAAWEEALAMLFQGIPRYQTLGIDQAKFNGVYSDENNEVIRERFKHLSVVSALEEFRKIHDLLMTYVRSLSDSDLNMPVATFFSHSSNDPRRVIDIIHANTSDHFIEHLTWIERLVVAAN